MASASEAVVAKHRSTWSETADSEGNGEEQIGQLKTAAGARSPVVNSSERLGFEVGLGLRLGLGLGVGLELGERRRELAEEGAAEGEEEEEEPRTRPWPLNLELEGVRFFMNPFILSLTSSIC